MKALYPWDRWFKKLSSMPDGRMVLARNRDYHCQSHGMAQQVRNAASGRGLSVTVETREKSLIVRLNCQN